MNRSSAAQADRVIDAALTCIARVGLGKTTLDDVAREAGCARATVYRCFTGKQALLEALVARETAAFGATVIEAAAGAPALGDAIVSAMTAAAAALRAHAALAFVSEHEPEILTPYLAFQRDAVMLRAAAVLIAPAFGRFVGSERAERLAEWVTRLTLSYLCTPSDDVDLAEAAHVRALVDDFVLPCVSYSTHRFEPVTTLEGVSE